MNKHIDLVELLREVDDVKVEEHATLDRINNIDKYIDLVELLREVDDMTVEEHATLDRIINYDLYNDYDPSQHEGINYDMLVAYKIPELEDVYEEVPAGNYSHDGFTSEYKLTHKDTFYW